MKRISGALIATVALTLSLASVASAEAQAATASKREVPDIEWPPADVTPPGHSRETLVEFASVMGKHLDTAFPAVVPDADGLWWIDWGGEMSGDIHDGQDYLTTSAVYEDKYGRTSTSFQIEAPGHFTASPREFCEMNGAECDARFQRDGSLVLKAVSTVEGGEREYHIGSVLHYRNDGTVVWVSAYDYDSSSDGNEGPDRDEIALTFKQLTALATDPALHL